jgi:tRNA threonylcarbamoyl adenosine modification protein (Sua5/YciO/YrdC/YwlC family)
MNSEMSPIRNASPGPLLPQALAEARACLERGELVVLPTETVYGLAADPAVPGAVERLLAAKERPPDKPIPWLIPEAGWEALPGLAGCATALALGRRYWPGPVTLVVDTPDGSRGYRMPDHPVAAALLRLVGRPLAVSSANRSGQPPAATAADAARALGAAAALILDAGPAPVGIASTVVRVRGTALEVLREGAVPRDEFTAGY